MNKRNLFFLALLLIGTWGTAPILAQTTASIYAGSQFWEGSAEANYLPTDDYKVNISISHGHCQTPYEGRFSDVNVRYGSRGMDDLKIDFAVSSKSLFALHEPEGEATAMVKGPNYFDAARYPDIRFACEATYKLGTDWYNLKGKLFIKDKSFPVSFHSRTIREDSGSKRAPIQFILDGKVNLEDFDIRTSRGEKTMSINLVIKAAGC